jgi:ribose transport system permease protein
MSFLVARGYGISILDERLWVFGGGYLGWIPLPAIIGVAIAGISYILLHQTRFGRNLFAIGGNKSAALVAGINITRTQMYSYIYCGTLAGVSGILWASRMATGSPTIGIGWELEVIAAVILGGTSLFGGQGSILGTFLGALFIGMVTDWLLLMAFQYYAQVILRGILLILVVGISVQQARVKAIRKKTKVRLDTTSAL